MKNIFFDLETTGYSSEACAIHEIGLYDPEGASLSIKVRPFTGAKIITKALEVSGVTVEALQAYPEEAEAVLQFKKYIGEAVIKYRKPLRFVGWNNRYFDNRFLKAFLFRHGLTVLALDINIHSYDLLQAIRSNHFRKGVRPGKLGDVARSLGIEVEAESLHGALYDAKLTAEIYKKLYGAYG
jgi:DNA polymerase III epsilon subunit-like protein